MCGQTPPRVMAKRETYLRFVVSLNCGVTEKAVMWNVATKRQAGHKPLVAFLGVAEKATSLGDVYK